MRLLALLLIAGCASAPQPRAYVSQFAYPLDADLVQVIVEMTSPDNDDDLAIFANCTVAAYAMSKDAGFARLVAINFTQTAGISDADAVYTISAALPPGVKTIDAQATLQSCRDLGVPTFVRNHG